MDQSPLSLAKAYYTAMGEKDITVMEKYLHPDVQFIAPLTKLKGKESYLEAVKGFVAFFKMLTIRAAFGSENQAMLAYDVDFPAPIGYSSAAVLLTFQAGLIVKIELFFDGRPFDQNR